MKKKSIAVLIVLLVCLFLSELSLAAQTSTADLNGDGIIDLGDIAIIAFRWLNSCSCDGVQCGDDGCGGSCGLCEPNDTDGYLDAGNSGTTYTFDFSGGQYFQKLTLTSDCMITLPTASVGQYQLQLTQDVHGPWTPTFSGVYWADGVPPVWTSTILNSDIISLVSDGTYYYEMSRALNLSPYTLLSNDLLSYFKLEDPIDEESIHTLSNIGTPTYEAGKLNNALRCDGSTDGLSDTTPDAALTAYYTSDASLSVCAWVYADPGALTDDRCIVSLAATDGTEPIAFEIRYDQTGPSGGETYEDNCYIVGVSNGGDGFNYARVRSTVYKADNNEQTWAFLCFVYDADTNVGTMYVNGVSGVDTFTQADNPTPQNTPALTVGYRNYGAGDRYWDGLVDNVCVFDGKALSQSEINELYNGGNGTGNF